MDHFTLPSHPLHSPLEIRLLEVEGYDHGDFITYPDRQGWGQRPLTQWDKIFAKPSSEFSAFLERWLFFGFMEVIFQRPLDISNFIRYVGDPSYPVLTTKCLPKLYQQLMENIKVTSAKWGNSFGEAYTVTYQMHAHLLVAARRAAQRPPSKDRRSLNSVTDLTGFVFSSGATRDPRTPGFAMATAAILESFNMIFSQDWYAELGYVNVPNGTGTITLPTWDSLIWTSLRHEGWCPSQLVPLFSRFNTAGLYFLHNLRRPAPDKTHQVIRIWKTSEASHEQGRSSNRLCSSFKCAHKQLDESTYKTVHADGCLQVECRSVVANQNELCAILANGKIPLIRVVDNDSLDKIELAEATPDMKYVAISHVWSDGLGNLDQNALHRCQLLRLSKMVHDLPGEYSTIRWFWLDTICVPPDKAGLPMAQNLALGLMRKTYEDATTVLVLDSWLFNSSIDDKSHVEILMRIFSCDWNTRLWTYQEGALARALHFQFSGVAYDLDHGMQELCAPGSSDIITSLTLLPPLKDYHQNLRGIRMWKEDMEERIAAIITALGYRTTSVESDEPLCLGVLLDLDVVKIAETHPNERMEKFWGMLPTVPNWLIFTSLATFQSEGLRWAPLTFLQSEVNKSGAGDPLAEMQLTTRAGLACPISRGLVVQFPGLRFFSHGNLFGKQCCVRDENGTWIIMAIDRFDAMISFGCTEVAFIANGPVGSVESSQSSGILVAISEEAEDILYCQKLANGPTIMEDSLPFTDQSLLWLQQLANGAPKTRFGALVS